MITGILKSSTIEGDDVNRVIEALENPKTKEGLMRRLYTLSRDPSHIHKSSRKARRSQPPQLPPFNQIARGARKAAHDSDHALASPSRTTEASEAGSESYHPMTHTHASMDVEFLLGTPYEGFDTFAPPSSPFNGGCEVLICDGQYSTLWSQRELPPLSFIDFGTHYLAHECTKSEKGEVVYIYSFDKLMEEYEYHQPGEIGEDCQFASFFLEKDLSIAGYPA
ncbi:hypothetical protein ABW19_dt0205124 [Dactylella cylindrospora]|nr:hypothetical protein ABW19_dt0205124 [Dactylella cylindrospora]